MDTLQKAVLIAHTLIALLIIILVLLQRGKGADAGAAFGSGASGTVFGARGSSNFFSRATAMLATVFFASSLFLAYLSSQQVGSNTDSVLENAAPMIEEVADPVADPAELPELGAPTPAESADELPTLEAPAADEAEDVPQ